MTFPVFWFFLTYQKSDVLSSSSHRAYHIVLKHYLRATVINREAISYVSTNVINLNAFPDTLALGPTAQALGSFVLRSFCAFLSRPGSLPFL